MAEQQGMKGVQSDDRANGWKEWLTRPPGFDAHIEAFFRQNDKNPPEPYPLEARRFEL